MREANTETTSIQAAGTENPRCVNGVCSIEPSFMERVRKAQSTAKEPTTTSSPDGLAA